MARRSRRDRDRDIPPPPDDDVPEEPPEDTPEYSDMPSDDDIPEMPEDNDDDEYEDDDETVDGEYEEEYDEQGGDYQDGQDGEYYEYEQHDIERGKQQLIPYQPEGYDDPFGDGGDEYDDEDEGVGLPAPIPGMGLDEGNPFNEESQPGSFINYEMMYQKYLGFLTQKITRAPWSRDMQDRYAVIAAQTAYPDVVLSNLTERDVKRVKSRMRLTLLKAKAGCDVDDTLTSEYVIYNDLIKNHLEFPLSRAKGPERERIIQIKRHNLNEQIVENRASKPQGQQKKGPFESLADIFTR
jgi:hypothetical protein